MVSDGDRKLWCREPRGITLLERGTAAQRAGCLLVVVVGCVAYCRKHDPNDLLSAQVVTTNFDTAIVCSPNEDEDGKDAQAVVIDVCNAGLVV